MKKKRSVDKGKEESINKRIYDIFSRYAILVLLALPGLTIFYIIFKPITIYPVYILLSFFKSVSLSGNEITVGRATISIINACVAGSAYYLLLILNLSTPNIKIKKRLKILGIAFASFLVLNILRIFVLGLMLSDGSSLFNLAHKLFWYFGTTIFLILVWFAEVKYYKIKSYPFVSDIKFLSRHIRIKIKKV